MARSPLGRGLNSLIPRRIHESSFSSLTSTENIREVSVNAILPNPVQPRETFNRETIESLVESIKKYGLLQPLLVVAKDNQTYELLAGERRLRAARLAGLKTVPVVLRDKITEQDRLFLALIENLQREDLNPIEEAKAYERLVNEYGFTHDEIGMQVGKSRSVISNALRLLKLPVEMQKAIAEGRVSFAAGRALAAVDDPRAQKSLFNRLLSNEKLSVVGIEREVRKLSPRSRLKKPELAEDERILREALGTKVVITEKKERGSIKISFESAEDRVRIIQRIVEGEKE